MDKQPQLPDWLAKTIADLDDVESVTDSMK
jgi:hypothetical protein